MLMLLGTMTLVLVILYIFLLNGIEKLTAAQPINVELKVEGVVPADRIADSLVRTNKLIAISSGGQRRFDLIRAQAFQNTIIFFHC